jgi:hypothetical protein
MLLMFRTLRVLDVLPLFDEMKFILSFKKKKKSTKLGSHMPINNRGVA